MTLAAETREAVDDHPFLRRALRAGVLNYSAAARFLELSEDESAVVAALRRYEEELPPLELTESEVRLSMHSGVGPTAEDPLLSVGDTSLGPDGGTDTAIVGRGEVGPGAMRTVLDALSIADIEALAAATGEGQFVVVVPGTEGASALRTIERALSGRPDDTL